MTNIRRTGKYINIQVTGGVSQQLCLNCKLAIKPLQKPNIHNTNTTTSLLQCSPENVSRGITYRACRYQVDIESLESVSEVLQTGRSQHVF